MYRIILSQRAKKDLSKLERPIKQKIDRALLKLKSDPFITNFKFLKDERLADFRVRIGDY